MSIQSLEQGQDGQTTRKAWVVDTEPRSLSSQAQLMMTNMDAFFIRMTMSFAQLWHMWVEERLRLVHVFAALILATVALVSATPEARAENGDGCAEGYASGSAPYQTTGPDGQPVMVQNTGCHPISTQDFWGAVAYASANGKIYANAYWNAYSARLAKKMALADCKKYLRKEKINGRCEIVGSGRNGSGWVSQGKNLSLYFGYDESEALSACRRVTVDCRMYAKLRSDGTQQSGVTWFE